MKIFPRSADRGLIEAARRSRPEPRATSDLRDQLIAASLKRANSREGRKVYRVISAIS